MLILVCSCAPKPSPIEYGSDVCHYCKMTIVDRQHAAELVTKKGKVYKFDAIECMIPYRVESNQEYNFVLVNDFNNPGKLTDAESSHYLVCNNIPSPMGAYLSAFSNPDHANKMKMNKGGEIYNWEEIQKEIIRDYSKL